MAEQDSAVDQATWKLAFYVAGDGIFTRRALANLEGLVEQLEDEVAVEKDIIDVTREPKLALELGIFSTPTLIASCDKRSLRFVGDLNDVDRVLKVLTAELG